MGNWRTVMLQGSVGTEHFSALRDAVQINDYMSDREWAEKGGPLAYTRSGSLLGLGDWVAPEIDTAGNLFERDYSVQDVAEHLERLVKVAPSLVLTVHCGGNWESPTCVATITVHHQHVVVGAPQVDRVDGVSNEEATQRLCWMLGR